MIGLARSWLEAATHCWRGLEGPVSYIVLINHYTRLKYILKSSIMDLFIPNLRVLLLTAFLQVDPLSTLRNGTLKNALCDIMARGSQDTGRCADTSGALYERVNSSEKNLDNFPFSIDSGVEEDG